MIASTRTYALELVRRRNGTKFCGVSVPPPDVTPSSSTFRAEFCETSARWRLRFVLGTLSSTPYGTPFKAARRTVRDGGLISIRQAALINVASGRARKERDRVEHHGNEIKWKRFGVHCLHNERARVPALVPDQVTTVLCLVLGLYGADIVSVEKNARGMAA